MRYDTNSSGFEFTPNGDNIVLRLGQLSVDVYESKKVLRVYAIRNGFRVTTRCAKSRCIMENSC